MPDLVDTLRSLADRDDLFPETPDLAADLAGQLGRPRPARDAPWRWVAIAVLVLLMAIAAAMAIPDSRRAVADFFGIEGIRIERGTERDLPGTPTSIGGSLLLGERSTLDDAIETVPFAIEVPERNEIGAPGEVWLNRRAGAVIVGLLWPAGEVLPEIGDTGVGMLLLEIQADDDDGIFIKKMIAGGEMTTVDVRGSTGIWIENGVLTVQPVEGLMIDLLEPGPRRSGNVLIWSEGAVTYRLETMLPKADAIRLATSLAPADDAGNP